MRVEREWLSLSRIGIIFPLQPTDIGSVLPYARIAATTGSRLWCGQSLNIETHAVFAALAGTGLDLEFGSSVTLMPLRHPYAAALAARSMAALSGNSYIAGVGPAATNMQQAVLGTRYRTPIAATERYVTMMREFLSGNAVRHSDGEWPTGGLALPALDTPPVDIGLGVLRPAMAALAGRVADHAITWLTPRTFVQDNLLPTMQTAAAAVDRPTPKISAVVHCAVRRPGRDLHRIAMLCSSNHLMAPHYTTMLRQAGIPVDPADPTAGASSLLEHGVIATGSADEIMAEIRNYQLGGVDEVIVNLCGVHLAEGPGAALSDLAAILAAEKQLVSL
jgi:alkanesulfonate monooxygenase SsuD/methylene tetrahydromethanopterin reductase-like flavin-dependent oxidoreductase (luciferase family)